MHISNGYTYMLSIIQFLNTLAEIVPVELLCLDSSEDIKKYFEAINHSSNYLFKIIIKFKFLIYHL